MLCAALEALENSTCSAQSKDEMVTESATSTSDVSTLKGAPVKVHSRYNESNVADCDGADCSQRVR